MKNIRKMLAGKVAMLVLVCSFFTFLACGKKGDGGPEADNPSPNIKLVKIMPVKAETLQGSVEYVGTLSANLKVNVATEMGGTIEKISFERGDRVKKGQVLAEVSTGSIRIEVQQAEAARGVAESNLEKMEKGSRPEEIRIAMAAVEQAEASVSEAENNFQRINDLYGYQAVSNSKYDSAKRGVETARANLESAKQQFELVKQGPRIEDKGAARARFEQAQAALAMAKDRLEKSVLRSPCNGIIAFRHVEEREVIGPGIIITQVVDMGKMKIGLSIGERYLPILDRQKQFPFTVDAITEEAFTCRLNFVSPTADPVTRSFPLELSVDKPDTRMADGMTVRVKFPLIDQKKSIKIPSAWLSEQEGQMGLFVVNDGKALFKKITLGSYYAHKVEILSGLNENDQVITNPAGLKTGDAVKH
jgi:multidrug efflux pump subunit AcrA (membrane-fusion protein)